MQLLQKGNSISNKILFLVIVLAYRITLDYSYAEVISKKFAYEGFYSNYSTVSEIISYIVLMVFSLVMMDIYRNEERKLSREVLLMLFLMSFVPFTSMFGFGVFNTGFIIANIIFWACLLAFTVFPYQIKRHVRFKLHEGKKIIGETQIKIISICFAIVVLYISARYTHFRFNFSLLNVYDLRSEARTYNLPTILTYAFSWTRTINSILVAYYIRKKNWLWAIVCIVIQLLNFGIDGSKTTLFLMIFAIIICLIPKFDLQSLNRWIVIGFFALVLGTVLLYLSLNNIVPISLFVRRLLYVPVDISSKYFDFFTTHTPDYYRQSFLRIFGFESPYESLAYMIGDYYYHQVSSANNGLISDAISNMGIPGIVIVPIMYSIVFRILDKVTDNLDPRLHITVAMYVALTLVNTFLFRVLLTHGLIVTMIILHLIDADDLKMVNNKNSE